MTFGVRPPSLLNRIDAAIAPTVAFCFSVLVAYLAPYYLKWYGDDMPALTHEYIIRYPLYMFITVGGVIMQVVGQVIGSRGAAHTFWKILDTALAVASTLIILLGMIALSVPLFTLQLPI